MPREAPGSVGHVAGRAGRKNKWLAAVALAVAASLAAVLYAATPLLRPPESDQRTLRGLQVRVLNISQAAAENRMDGALAALEALEEDLNNAAGQGLISLSRYRGIEAAVEEVRADINGQLAAAAVSATAEVAVATTSDTSTPAPVQPEQAPQVEPAQPAIIPAPVQPPAIIPAPVQPQPVLPGRVKEPKGKGKGKP